MSTHNPHDALVRNVFSRQQVAAGELRAVLPEALSARVDWGSLQLVDGCFVDPELEGRQTDLLFTADIADREALLYLLLEHQSTVDPLMPLRLLRYMLRIWDRWLADHPGARRIPVIVPVVLYHGEQSGQLWTGPTTMHEVLDIDETVLTSIRALVPDFELLLDDLGQTDDEQLRARAMDALGIVALLLLKHARAADDLLDKLVGWADVLRQVLEAPDGFEALGVVMRYTLLVSKHVTVGDINAVLVPAVGEKLREVVMTEGQRLIAQGEARGCDAVRRGIGAVLDAKGIALGDAERQQLIACGDLSTLERWLAKAAVARTAAEALA